MYLCKFKAVWSTSRKTWILFTPDGKKSIPSSAQNGLVKADGHEDQEKVLTDQLLSESPLCSLWQLADDRAPHRKGR